MNSPRRMLIAAAALLALVTTASAVPISGGISLDGAYTVNTGNLNTATAFTSFSNGQVSSYSAGSSFAIAGVLVGDASNVLMTPFSFNPFGGPVAPLWLTTVGPAAAFNLTSLSILFQGADTLALTGQGTLFLAGFDPTPGNWVFTANQAGGSFSWSSSNSPVPEGGTTAALLGGALLLMGLASRRFRCA